MGRESFKSRLGFILVSAGCAIGIGNVDTVSTKKAGPGYPGTGDIFVSIVSALTLRGFSLQECTTQAAHFIASCISYSQSLSDDTLQGVIFEPLLSDLVTL